MRETAQLHPGLSCPGACRQGRRLGHCFVSCCVAAARPLHSQSARGYFMPGCREEGGNKTGVGDAARPQWCHTHQIRSVH